MSETDYKKDPKVAWLFDKKLRRFGNDGVRIEKEPPTISRQRLYQMRQREKGRCRACPNRSPEGLFCKACRERNKVAYRLAYGKAACYCSHCGGKGHNIRACTKAKKILRKNLREKRDIVQGYEWADDPPPPTPKKPKIGKGGF